MLPIPNLDDRFFDQIVQEARKAIPKLLPEWTDENASDPGITLVELMSWMTEVQQYYLNRITEKNERKFLKLLGIKLLQAESASAYVTFSGSTQHKVLPKGTKLKAMDQPFETVETLQLIPAELDKIIVRTEAAASDYTSSNHHSGISYYAFGPEARSGSKLYLGFDQALPEHMDISIGFKLFDDYPVSIGKQADGSVRLVSSADVSWKYFGAEEGEGWLPVELVRDSTVHLSQTGQLVFRLPAPMKPMLVHPANDKRRYWICCTLEREGYELSPKLEQIHANAGIAAQRETWSETASFTSSGEAEMEFAIVGHLPFYGLNMVQVRDAAGDWRDWRSVMNLADCGPQDPCYELHRDKQIQSVKLVFGNGSHALIPPAGDHSIRLISYTPEFELERWLGRSSGLPNQEFEFDRLLNCLSGSFQLQIGCVKPGAEELLVWEDWSAVEDFDHSGSEDRHYVLDTANGIIRFGNNEEGLIPHKAEINNVRIISLQTGGGLRGNVKDGLISEIVTAEPELLGIRVTNPFPAAGGTENETIAEAKLRVRQELHTPYRAVTGEDYEAIARSTPGVRVARVKAIPLYKPGMKIEQQEKAPAQMTVVVVPYSEAAEPKAGSGFLQTVRRHLDLHRLLTTELHVIPAEYIKISVHAVVVMEPHMKGEARRIIHELQRLLHPLDQGSEARGWPFGRAVYKGDIYGAISRVKGVVYVQDLWIDYEGAGARKDASGDIIIPPYGLVTSGGHEIELLSKNDV
ncbi:putative baseplate assembly protein [Paenibacillus radicis (ex Xue et al. 2023)]|uniref:Baseplate assembly protein n=1 Tax=Paenibacillus radicis (ex Xue et al. 2023) TaxID=2972489 RepID=A0ABT1YKT5_9BACL|nr:putative baseplate assembly protein [Paenibacillus radicis (ex Xue et al. 2023)]MCR8633781.1 putative baseplate assembly protein [Paenibacillus radicis (ex Xue et al. 2023)]